MKKTSSVTILMTEDEKKRIKAEAKKQGFDDLSPFIRWLLRKEVK